MTHNFGQVGIFVLQVQLNYAKRTTCNYLKYYSQSVIMQTVQQQQQGPKQATYK